MQFFMLAQDLITDKNISANEFRIYTYLMSIYNEKQGCSFPSMDKIVEKLGMTKPTVNKSIKKLVELGYMIVEKQKAKIGNFNKYTNFKHLVSVNEENVNSYENKISTETPKVEKAVEKKVEKNEIKREPLIVSDWKESGVQIEIEELNPYSIEHQQKISLVLKQGINLSEKQEFLIGEMDLESLRKAIYQFKKKKGKYFSLLLSLYIDQAEEVGVYVSKNIEKYLKGSYIRMTPEERETQEALKELELYGIPYVVA